MSNFKVLSLTKKKDTNIITLHLKMLTKDFIIKFKCNDENRKSFTQHELFNIGLLTNGTSHTRDMVRSMQLFRIEKDLSFIKGLEML